MTRAAVPSTTAAGRVVQDAPARAIAPTDERARERLHAGIEAFLSGSGPSPRPDPSTELTPIAALERGAPLSADEAAIDGQLPGESIQRTVRLSAGRFRDCYRKGLERQPQLEGRVVVRFSIRADGLVRDAREETTSLADRATRQCVLATFFDLTFPPARGEVAVSYPLRFEQGGGSARMALPSARRTAQAPPPGFAQAFQSGTRVPGVPPHDPGSDAAPSVVESCDHDDPMCGDLVIPASP
ncbi:MAG: AgmX/PglI C-terminal domain-containing protein [Polyangiaceae bacterium]